MPRYPNDPSLPPRDKMEHTITLRLTKSQFKELTHISDILMTPRTSVIVDAVNGYLKGFRQLDNPTVANYYAKK